MNSMIQENSEPLYYTTAVGFRILRAEHWKEHYRRQRVS